MIQAASLSANAARFRRADLPLAVYQEITAHLRQVPHVRSGWVYCTAGEFDYNLSQVDYLWVDYEAEATDASRSRVDRILSYYSDRFGAWEVLPSS